ncbi:hypothetical protein NIBR502772_08005 [Pseudarthrobacter sp. NIBRBAC000502772]|uniref:hypothetical protein n=1 Tax=Pseudarthrobacter sp. NIBRBAC000502772 TaxID=2590775 RepID=UPI00113228F7|nr:hypothetical protein [Pseudarthrobacter sp. NIBRBAC000502772]QDG66161.1 hypothetical protein NIBR502772_08005 [Pseudarthrobacter sp. NIBRBAC000502772]
MGGQFNRPTAGALLVAAGAAWVIKAMVIITTGQQPDLLFQTGLIVCAVGLYMLLSGFQGPRRVLTILGAAAAGAAFAATGAAVVMEIVPGAQISRGDAFVFPFSALVLLGGVGVFIAMVALGIAYYNPGQPFRWTVIPLFAALMPAPAALTGFIHAEFPILLIGLSWATAGAVIAVRETEKSSLAGNTGP